MRKSVDTAATLEPLDLVWIKYLEKAEAVKGDSVQLRLLRERCLAEHLEFVTELQGHFQDEDAIFGRIDCVCDSPPVLERYRAVARLGEGGQAVVYKAFDQKLNTWVALKMSKFAELGSAGEAQRFRFEAQSMAQLKHPNVVRIFDVKDYKGCPFLSMEYVPGGSLHDHLDRFRDDQRSAARLMVKISRAVHHAHQRRILHRDLKPSNILLDTDDTLDRPCVSDFGLAKPIDLALLQRDEEAEPGVDMAEYGKIVGTASFMSPEQANAKDVTTLSDVYGLGTILYSLLTGKPPFLGDTVEDTLKQVRDTHRKPTAPRLLNPGVDRTLQAVCMKCLEKDPLGRYRSAEGLAKDLDRWLDHQLTEARPRNPAQRLQLWCRRNPIGLILAALVMALLTLTVVNVVDRLQEPGRAQAVLARQQADTLEIRLRQLGQALAAGARQPQLGELLLERNQPALQALIEEIGNSRVDLGGSSPFESWFVIDSRDGAIVARWPEMSADTEGIDFRGRDYFEGLNRVSGTYVSQVFKALSDQLYKFGISAWVEHKGENVGVLVATVTTSPQMGLPDTEDQGLVTALLARRDRFVVPGETGTPPEEASDFILLLHPAYQRGIEPVWFPRDYLAAVQSGSAADYQDPVGSQNGGAVQRYEGRWVASFAPVADSEFVVLAQQRYVPVLPQEIWPMALWVFAAIILMVALRYGYRKA
ncbi:MAG: protein kinase [Acidobacteriota bacterium]